MEYWYARASTNADRHDIGRQKRELVKLGIKDRNIFSRSTKQLCEILEFAEDNHLKLIIGGFIVDCTKEDIDTVTMEIIRMMAVFAQMEREITVQRIKSGMANAKAKGVELGRPELTVDTLPYNFLKYYPMFQNGNINLSELSRISGISRPTIYKYLDIIENSNFTRLTVNKKYFGCYNKDVETM